MSHRSRRVSQRNDIIRRINNLQEAKAHIDNECEHFQNLLSELTLVEPSVDQSTVSSSDSVIEEYPLFNVMTFLRKTCIAYEQDILFILFVLNYL